MNIKTFTLIVVLNTAALAGIHAFGIGAQFNFKAGEILAPGAALTFSPTDRIHIAANWYLDLKKVNYISLTLDFCPVTIPITDAGAGALNFTFGFGFFSTIAFSGDPGINGGLRLPVGLSLMPGQKMLELYAHIAPSFGLHFVPNLKLSNPFLPMALGIRLWFQDIDM